MAFPQGGPTPGAAQQWRAWVTETHRNPASGQKTQEKFFVGQGTGEGEGENPEEERAGKRIL